MADKKISALTGATTPLAGTEVLPVVQGGATVKVAVSDLTAGRAVAASSINKVVITAPATASTLTIADGKTLAVNDNATLGTGGLTLGNSGGFTAAASKVLTANNTLTLAGTDATTHTFPATSSTIARTDAAQTFTGNQTLGTGNLVQGTAAKGFNFTANTPAAGMTSQLFNWYEEGTFTAGIAFGGAAVGVTYDTTPTCAYTKIGRQVTVTGRVGLTSKGSSTGNATITGLPFTSANTGNAGYGATSIAMNLVTFANQYVSYIVPNSTSLSLYENTILGVQSAITDADFGSASNLLFTATYFV